MTVEVQVFSFTPEEAVTTTEKIEATIDTAVRQHGEKVITELVIGAGKRVAEAAVPLAGATEIGFVRRFAIDLVEDRGHSAVYNICDLIEWAFDQNEFPLTKRQQETLDAARTVKASAYPDGIGFARGRWVSQYGSTDIFLQKTKEPKLAAAIETLHFEVFVDFIEKTHREYGRRMGYTTADQTPSALSVWHDALEAYLSAVIAKHPRGALRDQLTSPYEEMANAAREAIRSAKEALAKGVAEKTEPSSPDTTPTP
jgi:hypothetical protein